MVRRNTRTLGGAAEQLARRYLECRGLKQVAGNYSCRGGEIDLVMLDKDCLVFVEVRYRSARAFSSAALTVDRHKQNKLVLAAEMFLATRPAFANHAVRFDVIGIDADADGRRTMEWIRDAFAP